MAPLDVKVPASRGLGASGGRSGPDREVRARLRL